MLEKPRAESQGPELVINVASKAWPSMPRELSDVPTFMLERDQYRSVYDCLRTHIDN